MEFAREHFNHSPKGSEEVESPLQKSNYLQMLLAERVYLHNHPDEKIDMHDHNNKNRVMTAWISEGYAEKFGDLKNNKEAGLLDMDAEDSSALDTVALSLYRQVNPASKDSRGALDKRVGGMEI